MITPEFLQGCTDEQINIMTAWVKLRHGVDVSNMSEYLYAFQRGWSTRRLRVLFNPCTNPNDAWPIILENRIGITFGYSGERAVKILSGKTIQVINANPLRAICEVYLLMGNKS